MIAVDDDLTVEMLFQKLEADGMDMTQMRTASASINAMPTGDNTPPPGTLLVEPTLVIPPALHQSIYDTPEGPFYLPPFSKRPGKHYSIADLRKQVARLRFWVTGLTMCFISALVIAVVKW